MKTTFTMPGKSGDAIMQWPVAFWWHRKHGKPFDVWMDAKTCKPLVNLFGAQAGVEDVQLKDGIESYHCGGQPWNFGLTSEDHAGRQIVHLGMREFPKRQLTLQAFEDAPIALEHPPEMADTPVFEIPEPMERANRLVLHGQARCPHTGTTPGFWRFLASIREELPKEFEEIVWIGSNRDVDVGKGTYPDWGEFRDDGDFLKVARLIQSSRMVIACGSSMAALAGALKIPCVRVHDPIGNAAKVIWSNLGKDQLNATEIELRAAWPEFRDRILGG